MKVDDDIAAMIDDVFECVGSLSAQWTGIAYPVRVIFPPEINDDFVSALDRSSVTLARTFIDVRVSDVPAPAKGDQVMVGDDVYRLVAEPRRIKGGRVWHCEALAITS